MKIVICGSISFTPKIKEIADKLKKRGHSVEIPFYSQKILSGEISLEEFERIKQQNGDLGFRKQSQEDLIKRYFRLIKKADAILVVNLDKRGVKNYIGGNTFLEMGFAYVLNKKIFLFNDIPDMLYKDEIRAMKPIIINRDLNKIQWSWNQN